MGAKEGIEIKESKNKKHFKGHGLARGVFAACLH